MATVQEVVRSSKESSQPPPPIGTDSNQNLLNPSKKEMEFRRVGLLMSRPMLWNTSENAAKDFAERICNLIEWCLELPDVKLKIPNQDPEQDGEWIELKEKQLFWLEQTRSELRQKAEFAFWSPDQIISQLTKYNCRLFAPLNMSKLLEKVNTLLEKANERKVWSPQGYKEIQKSYQKFQNDCNEIKSKLENYSLYWSWEVLNFVLSNSYLVYLPILALWSDYPDSKYWAPAPREQLSTKSPLSEKDAIFLLEEVMYEKLEQIFTFYIRCSFKLLFPVVRIDQFECQPPVFYFAEPINCLQNPNGYLEENIAPLYPLVKTCLKSDDPCSQAISWGVLEGDFVTLRSTTKKNWIYQPYYLILPFVRKEISPLELEEDLANITYRFSHLEFDIAYSVAIVYFGIEPLNYRLQNLKVTIDDLNTTIADVMDLSSRVGRFGLKRIQGEIGKTLLALKQLLISCDLASAGIEALRRDFNFYEYRTEDYFRNVITFSAIASDKVYHCSLERDFLDAYPYYYVRQPLDNLSNLRDHLFARCSRLSETINSQIEEVDRMTRANMEKWTGRLSWIAALVAVSIAIPGLFPNAQIDTNSGIGKFATEKLEWNLDFLKDEKSEVGQFLTKKLKLNPAFLEIETLAECVILTSLIGLLLVVALFIVSEIGERLPRRNKDHILVKIKRVKGAIQEVSFEKTDQEIEQIDDHLCRLIDELWTKIYESQRLQKMGASELQGCIDAMQRLNYQIYFLDLSPDFIPLPRTACIYRYKLGNLSLSAFTSSLGAINFTIDEIERLDQWLDHHQTQQMIRNMTVYEFSEYLKKLTVTSNAQERNPRLWVEQTPSIS